jgi:peroxiredoxin
MRRFLAMILAVCFVVSGVSAYPAPGDLVGKPAPMFSGKQVSGEPLALKNFLGKGPVILTFWSIYCKSCTEEMSALQRLSDKYGKEKLSVIAVNEDGDVGIDRVRNFLERFSKKGGEPKLTFPILFDKKEKVFNQYSVVHLPTLVYIGRDGKVREVIEGYDRGKELAVLASIEKLIGEVSPGTLKEVTAEAVYDLDIVAPICGTYRDGKWFRPLDLDETGRPEAIARARAEGEEHLRREAIRLALAELGISLRGKSRIPECAVSYGLEIRTPRREPDTIDLLIARLNLPRVIDVVDQETIERDRGLVLYRRIKIHLQALQEQLGRLGYTRAKNVVRVRFVRASPLEERSFVEAVQTQFPYLSEIRKEPTRRGGREYQVFSHAAPDQVVETMRGLDVGPRKLSVDLLPGDIAEVAMWR